MSRRDISVCFSSEDNVDRVQWHCLELSNPLFRDYDLITIRGGNFISFNKHGFLHFLGNKRYCVMTFYAMSAISLMVEVPFSTIKTRSIFDCSVARLRLRNSTDRPLQIRSWTSVFFPRSRNHPFLFFCFALSTSRLLLNCLHFSM